MSTKRGRKQDVTPSRVFTIKSTPSTRANRVTITVPWNDETGARQISTFEVAVDGTVKFTPTEVSLSTES